MQALLLIYQILDVPHIQKKMEQEEGEGGKHSSERKCRLKIG